MNNKDILQILKADFRSTESFKSEIDIKRKTWIGEYNAEPYGNEQKGKSAIVSQDIRKQNEWQFPSLMDPFVSSPNIVRANPVTAEDRAGATQAQHLLNYQFCRNFRRYHFMSNAIKVYQREGTVVVRTGWEFKEEKQTVMVPQEVPIPLDPLMVQEAMSRGVSIPQPTRTMMVPQEQMVTVINKPTAEVLDNIDVFLDPE